MKIRSTGALVTGASRGLGEALAKRLAEGGARVVLNARDEKDLARVAYDIAKAGGEAHVLAADIGKKTDVHPLALAAAAMVGEVDILIHNASALGPVPLPLLLDLACEDFAKVLETNVIGPQRLTRAVAGGMILRKKGVIVFVSSDAAVNAYPTWGAYGTSKAALDHLARTLAAELEGTGVRVLVVDPGEMDTAMHAAALPDADRTTLARPDDVARKIAEMIEGETRAKSGSRIEASQWSAS